MGKCVKCGNETTGIAESIISDHKRYLCSDCFNKEQSQGCLFTAIASVVTFIVLIVLAIIFQ